MLKASPSLESPLSAWAVAGKAEISMTRILRKNRTLRVSFIVSPFHFYKKSLPAESTGIQLMTLLSRPLHPCDCVVSPKRTPCFSASNSHPQEESLYHYKLSEARHNPDSVTLRVPAVICHEIPDLSKLKGGEGTLSNSNTTM